ncbi:MAG: hypothetical protein M0R28_09985 [Pigmentiphaga sp.]|nr:hypothetical protein [Pigmentiphaga sp.]
MKSNKNPAGNPTELDAHAVLRRRLLGTALAASASPMLLSACGGDDNDPVPVTSEPPPDTTPPPQSGGPASSIFTVKDRKILLNGKEFFAKGMCYSPVPIGAEAGREPGGDHFSDFWEALFTRDLSVLHGMGCNSIRLYMASPWAIPWDSNSGRQYHGKFMDLCAKQGIYVWLAYPMTPKQAMSSSDRPRIEQGYRLLCEELGKHPALIGFTIGNETDVYNENTQLPDFWAWMDDLARKVKSWAPDKLVKTAIHDIPPIIDQLVNPAIGKGLPHLDVIGLNSYRGTVNAGFDTLFTDYDAKFKTTGLPDRPFLITEFGCPASTRNGANPVELPNKAKAQADYLEVHWKDIVKHHGMNLCSGGYVFSWADEWWKAGNITQHDGHSSCTAGEFPGGCADEEWYGINSIQVGKDKNGNPRPAADPVVVENNVAIHYPDILTQRAAVARLRTLWKA